MKQALVTICLLGLAAVTVCAHALPEQETDIDVKFEAQSQLLAEEAVLVGHILHAVSSELKQDDQLYSENEEYFLRMVWKRTKAIAKNAGRKIKEAAKNAAKEAKVQLKAVAKEAQRRASDKAIQILSKILSKNFRGYALNEYETKADFVNDFCSRIDVVALRLTEQGKKFGAL